MIPQAAMRSPHRLHGPSPVGTNSSASRTVPFDYVFTFDLKGEPDYTQSATLTVSIEAAFAAVSIGYGIVPVTTPVPFGLLTSDLASATDPTAGAMPDLLDLETTIHGLAVLTGSALSSAVRRLAQELFLHTSVAALANAVGEPRAAGTDVIGPATAEALRVGWRLKPSLAETVLLALPTGTLDEATIAEMFELHAAPAEAIQFKYALFDEATGREFQNEPILSTAGWGTADGDRPFRHFAQPIEFAPRSTIRLQITEVSTFQGELQVVLQGYKTLGDSGTSNTARPGLTGWDRRL